MPDNEAQVAVVDSPTDGAPRAQSRGATAQRWDPTVMALRGRIGAYVLHSRRDPVETTQAARTAFLRKFESLVDPDCVLPEVERLRRAEAARRAHMARLALASVKARSKHKSREVAAR